MPQLQFRYTLQERELNVARERRLFDLAAAQRDKLGPPLRNKLPPPAKIYKMRIAAFARSRLRKLLFQESIQRMETEEIPYLHYGVQDGGCQSKSNHGRIFACRDLARRPQGGSPKANGETRR
jgi:hypothetical protein